ncbi:unnamed protein product [Mytilus edulis]|uniref:Fucolectin tachylectin-4 pentraxin-1 domain-containing protein n=1 Tax=Mytilus edulis TaxID=6550 RepID=A0A8S3QNQ6_MYTED|nr:unnamed protein product [Mytilus edulis]
MESLEPHQLLLVMDWAMKFLPMRYREKQSDFFGQKGLNWHVSVAIVKPENTTLQHKTYVHLFDGVRQDWFAVASIIENTLMTIKKQMPNIEEVFLRSDNAGCYHCGCLWLSLYGISQRTGLKILRYDYSEAQSGKSFCDAKIAHMRSKMKMFVSSGNNISSAEEMKAAIMSGAGVTGCQCAVADVDTSKQEMTSHRFKGVNSFSNLEFQDGDILVWNSYNIGIGKKIPRSSVLRQEQGETGLNVINDEPRATYGAIKSKDNSTTANHQDNMSDRDTEGTSSDMGWALRKERKFVRFSTEVKDFLKQEFEAGEISGKKSNPVTTSINMRTKVDEHGVRVFKADQFLQPSQIASFFARLSVMSKKTAPQQGTLDLPEENDDDLFNIIREIEEGEIHNCTINLKEVAHNKPSEQSSVYSARHSASRAVDGHVKSFIHTNIEQSPYWIVDLGKNYQIQQIKIFNKNDGDKSTGERLRDLDIMIGPSHNKMQICAHYVGPAKLGEYLQFTCEHVENARYVKLVSTGTNCCMLQRSKCMQ